jgi:hypothetical protein
VPLCLHRLEQLGRNADEEGGRDEEGDGVDPVRSVRTGRGDENAADDRPDRPGGILQRLEDRVGAREILVPDEVGQAGIDGGTEEARGEAGNPRQGDDQRRAVDERQRGEDREPHEVGADHQAAPRHPVDEGARRDPDHDRGQEVSDQQRADPGRGARPVEDVDREGDERNPGAEARGQRREGEQTEARRVSQKPELAADHDSSTSVGR